MIKQALILAGGRGERLKPISDGIPKPMIPINGLPLLEYTLKNISKKGVKKAVLSVGYLAEKIISHFGKQTSFGLEIEYSIEKEPLGTAGAIKLAEPLLEENFFCLNGDLIMAFDLNAFSEFHSKNNSLATILLRRVEDTKDLGIVLVQGKKILRFAEKNQAFDSKITNAGAYILNKKIIEYIPEGKSSLEYDVFPKIAKEGKLYGFQPKIDYWYHITDIPSLKKIENQLRKEGMH